MFGQNIVAIITPFDQKGRILFEYFEKYLTILNNNEVETILCFGTCGEGVSLSLTEIKDTLEIITDNKQQMNVMIGLFQQNIEESIELLNFAEDLDIIGALISPPFYFKDLNQKGLYHFFSQILEKTDLPIIIYNIPKYTGISIEKTLINGVLDYSQFIGIKDSSGEISHTQLFIDTYPNLTIYSGNDSLIFDALKRGSSGFITAIGNIFPLIGKRILQNFKEGKFNEAKRQQIQLTRIRTILKAYPQISNIKECISYYHDLPKSYIRPPLVNIEQKQRDQMIKELNHQIADDK